MNFDEEKTESNSKQPILVVLILLIIAGVAFYYFNQQITNSLATALAPDTQPFTIPADPDIKFNFLNSKEFAELASFPDYPSFKEDDVLTVKAGRINPFSPSGIGIQAPQKPAENQTVQNQSSVEESVPNNTPTKKP